MESDRKRKVLKDVFRRYRAAILFYVVSSVVNYVIFMVYGVETEPIIYAGILVLFCFICLFIKDYIKKLKKAEDRERILTDVESQWRELDEPENFAEEDYQKMISLLGERIRNLEDDFSNKRTDMMDYYTTWVHQIKTPIAVMKLYIGNMDGEEKRDLSAELFRIEQYVDMVLQYLRLESESNDLVIREYPVDELIRECIRKFAPQFIGKKIKMDYKGTDLIISTDKKCFICILEQLLSNAVKYTQQGSVSIEVTEDGKLNISDTGMGIAKEDLPRIFEKGYTGINGRLGQKSSGLGLYLCKKAAQMISVPISVKSEPGKGSTFTLNLYQEEWLKLD